MSYNSSLVALGSLYEEDMGSDHMLNAGWLNEGSGNAVLVSSIRYCHSHKMLRPCMTSALRWLDGSQKPGSNSKRSRANSSGNSKGRTLKRYDLCPWNFQKPFSLCYSKDSGIRYSIGDANPRDGSDYQDTLSPEPMSVVLGHRTASAEAAAPQSRHALHRR